MIVLWLGVEIACCVFLIKVARWVMREWRRHRDVILARSLTVPDVNRDREHFRQVDPASCPCARCCAAVDLVRSIADPLAWDRAFVEQLERP